MTEDQINHMASRLLSYPLPENFNPDGGISFERIANKGTQFERRNKPVGTNLLDYQQAKEMVLHIIEGLPESVGGVK